MQRYPEQLQKLADVKTLLHYAKNQRAKKMLGYANSCLKNGWTPKQCATVMQPEGNGTLGLIGQAMRDLIAERDNMMEVIN